MIGMSNAEMMFGVGGLLLGGGALLLYSLLIGRGAKAKAQLILDEAQRRADDKIRDSEVAIKELELKSEAEAERKLSAAREEIHQRERGLDKRETGLNQQSEDLKKQEQFIESSQNRLKVKLEQVTETERDLSEVLVKQRKELHQMTGLSKEEATSRLLKLLEDELDDEVGGRILNHEKKMQEICEAKSREILMMTTQRYAASQTSESTTSTVDIPNDDMKGRIIGREGRNIRAFEKETGVDVIIDDSRCGDRQRFRSCPARGCPAFTREADC